MRRALHFTIMVLIWAWGLPAQAGGLNDTGITTCANATDNEQTCPIKDSATDLPIAGFAGQDAEYGRDYDYDPVRIKENGFLKIGDGEAAFDFTKLDANGNEFPPDADAPNLVCVRDNVTDLTWEIKTDDGGLHDQDWTYSWYDSTAIDGNFGSIDSGFCYKNGRCDTEKFVHDVNSEGLCGFNDWRVPTVKELSGIIHYHHAHPALDVNYFPHTLEESFWTSSTYAGYSYSAWDVNFTYGVADYHNRGNYYRVRLVRGKQSFDNLIDNEDGTITQKNTGLMWAQCSEGQTTAACTGKATLMTWSDALIAAKKSSLGRYHDWRVPSIRELQALAIYSRVSAAINPEFFPNTPFGTLDKPVYFWSSSPAVLELNNAVWCVDFLSGTSTPSTRDKNKYYVRLVRDAQSQEANRFTLNVIKTGTGSGIVTSTDGKINCTIPNCAGCSCYSADFNSGDTIILTAQPAANSVFAGWGGACVNETGTCSVQITKAQTVTAKFDPLPNYTLSVSVIGNGTVNSYPVEIDSSNGIIPNIAGNYCQAVRIVREVIDGKEVIVYRADCIENYPSGTTVTLIPLPANGYVFTGWGSACTGIGTCYVSLNGATIVTAFFDSACVATERDTKWKIAEIYIATLGYAPDQEGLQYWENNVNSGGWELEQVAQSFFDQPLVQEMYPATISNDIFIETLHQNIFGRSADDAGKQYWLEQLSNGNITRNQMVIALINGGWANPDAAIDMQRFKYRVQVALAFAAAQAKKYSELAEDKQAALRRVGTQVFVNVTADILTRDAAIASIPVLLRRVGIEYNEICIPQNP